MIGTIIYIIGVILAIKAVVEIFRLPIGTAGKLISSIFVVCTSWLGIIVYYLFAKDKLTKWFN